MNTEQLTPALGTLQAPVFPRLSCTLRYWRPHTRKGVHRMTPDLRGELRHNESMAHHVSWRAGGCAARTYRPADLSDLRDFLRRLPPSEPVYFVGLGSNLLVRDGGLEGTVIFTHWALRDMRVDAKRNEIYAEAGLPSPKIARVAALHGMAGAEFLAGIPGTVGGALAMNAGCYGGETWEIVASVRSVDRSGALHERTPAEYEISYRTVVLKGESERPNTEEWFVGATFKLAYGDARESREKIRSLLKKRITTQPLNQPNAGSVFRNPPGEFAARLIEACGLKGHAIGGAMISPRHANFIVNCGNASASDIEHLIDLAQHAVKQKFNIELEREVRILGARAANEVRGS